MLSGGKGTGFVFIPFVFRSQHDHHFFITLRKTFERWGTAENSFAVPVNTGVKQ